MDPSWVVAACAVLTALITIGAQWVRYENKLTDLNNGLASALQVGAEAAKDAAELKEKIYSFENWSRDEFVRKQSLEALLARNEKAQETRDERLERRLDRIESKLDAASAHQTQK